MQRRLWKGAGSGVGGYPGTAPIMTSPWGLSSGRHHKNIGNSPALGIETTNCKAHSGGCPGASHHAWKNLKLEPQMSQMHADEKPDPAIYAIYVICSSSTFLT